MPELVALSHVIVRDEDVLESLLELKTNGMGMLLKNEHPV